jgi:hypothetical protein
MNRTERHPEFGYLEAERQRPLDGIATVYASGTVAPAHCWLIESMEEKGSRNCTYAHYSQAWESADLKVNGTTW